MSTLTYRGRSLDDVLPRIKAELGPDAVVVRQRTGLTGGVAGFFQKQCIEIEARRNGIDVYDEPLVRNDEATRNGLASPGVQQLIEQARPFAEELEAAASAPVVQPAIEGGLDARNGTDPSFAATPVSAAPAPLVAGRRRPAEAAALEEELVKAGLRREIAASVVAETVSHLLPFASPDRLRPLVRDALGRRIRVAPSWAGAGRALAFVGAGGSGKTACVARLASAYAVGSDLPVVCLTLAPADRGAALRALLAEWGVTVEVVADGDAARARLESVRGHAAVVLDTPGLSTCDEPELSRLARELAKVGIYETHLALPATLSGPAAAEQWRTFAALGASRIALTHADETEHVGPVLGLAITEAAPVSFVAPAPGRLAPADAGSLARRLLP
jgi:flagellar biosynthesis GTPase FlhF